MDTTQSAQADHKTNKVLVNVVLDRSGSMQANRQSTVDGYNEYLNGLRQDKDSEYSLTLIQFDLVGAKADLTINYVDKPLTEVSDLALADYEPRGTTPLYDAIGECIRRVEAKDRGVITLIVTDGHENASLEFTRESVKKLIGEKEAEGWAFTFLGANIDSFTASGAIGMSALATANFAAGNEKTAFRSFAESTRGYGEMSRTVGVMAASAAPRFTKEQREAMGGPQRPTPPVAPSFRPPAAAPAKTTPVDGVSTGSGPRKWSESSGS